MGFDILYLPPIHPIGRAFRKGPNNSTTPGPDDEGSPWAIGSAEGGHKSIHPSLGSFADFDHLLTAVHANGMELALDIAFQCSPDHPWVTQHPDWFLHRPDGTIQYAENPAQEVSGHLPAQLRVPRLARPVGRAALRLPVLDRPRRARLPRRQSPHQGPRLLGVVHRRAAPRRPRRHLPLRSLHPPARHVRRWPSAASPSPTPTSPGAPRRPSCRPTSRRSPSPPSPTSSPPTSGPTRPTSCTPRSRPEAAPPSSSASSSPTTLAASYGIYGPAFELGENVPIRPGSEEYLNSEKYQIRRWNRRDPNSLAPLITLLNQIRRANPALQSDLSLHFHPVDNPQIIAYSKSTIPPPPP